MLFQNTSYPPEILEEIKRAAGTKKTVGEAKEFLLSFIEILAQRCHRSVPVLSDHDTGRGFKTDYQFIYRGHVLRAYPIIRFQGDEKDYQWEPGHPYNNGDRYPGDRICVSFAGGEQAHDCPHCECPSPLYSYAQVKTLEELTAWMDGLGG